VVADSGVRTLQRSKLSRTGTLPATPVIVFIVSRSGIEKGIFELFGMGCGNVDDQLIEHFSLLY
jgi:hypothetical protein